MSLTPTCSKQKAVALHALHVADSSTGCSESAEAKFDALAAALGVTIPRKRRQECEVWLWEDDATAFCLSIQLDQWQGWSTHLSKI